MSRIKRGTVSKRKHKKILQAASGYRMSKHRLIKVATEAVMHAGQYAYEGRKRRKRDMRRLWITRISEAVKGLGWSYNQFMHRLKEKKITLNRKMLAHLVTHDQETFKKLVEKVRA